MFSPPVYLSVGDEYEKRVPKKEAFNAGAKTFVVPAKRNPHIIDATFDPFVSLSAGDPYQSAGYDPSRKSATVKSDVLPFKPPGVSHKSSGKGDYYGTFSEKNPAKHEAEFPPLKASSASQVTDTKRNFLTNRSKKGTYGYPGLTIGQAGEIQYVSDPFEGNKRKEALASKMAAEQRMGAAPFRTAVKSGGCFDESEHGFSKVYSLSKPLAPKKPQQREPAHVAERPWVPGGALTKEITKFPEYQEDPYDVKERKIREMRQKESSYKAWNPVGNDPYRYIYTKPIQYNPPPVK